ncbi:MAG: hypothetical protein JNK82_27015 [Myxococcaceae bacterium]|nr:hypothetical protein [Myxococcaceae bacterium]
MVTIEHASAYAHDPQRAAEHLAALCGGKAEPFHPNPGAWVCLFDRTWSGPFIELYPRTSRLSLKGDEITFEAMPVAAAGAGTHFNLRVDRTRPQLEQLCAERGLTHGWRAWAGFLDVWLDEGLMVELVCSG